MGYVSFISLILGIYLSRITNYKEYRILIFVKKITPIELIFDLTVKVRGHFSSMRITMFSASLWIVISEGTSEFWKDGNHLRFNSLVAIVCSVFCAFGIIFFLVIVIINNGEVISACHTKGIVLVENERDTRDKKITDCWLNLHVLICLNHSNVNSVICVCTNLCIHKLLLVINLWS